MAEQANAVDLAQATRRMLDERGAPRTAENYNRAMLAILHGQETTDFDSQLDRYASPSRGATRGRSNGRARGEIENKPPETATAGDANRPQYTTGGTMEDGPANVQTAQPSAQRSRVEASIDRMLASEGKISPTRDLAQTVPGTSQVTGSPATVQGTGTRSAEAATSVTGTPDAVTPDAPVETFRGSLERQGILADGGLNADSPAVRQITDLVLGFGGGGFRTNNVPRSVPDGGMGGGGGTSTLGSGGLPPGSVRPPTAAELAPRVAIPGKGGLPADPSPTAYRMYPEPGPTITQGPARIAPTPPAVQLPGAPSPTMLSPPPAPAGSLPPPPIYMRPGPTQARPAGTSRPIGQPRLETDRGNVGKQQDTQVQRSRAISQQLRNRKPPR